MWTCKNQERESLFSAGDHAADVTYNTMLLVTGKTLIENLALTKFGLKQSLVLNGERKLRACSAI